MRRGVATESRGRQSHPVRRLRAAQRRPFSGSQGRRVDPNPFIIQKQDGGFNYATTDLATLAHRMETWHADEVIYVTDGRQQLHFRQLFAAFRRWHPEWPRLGWPMCGLAPSWARTASPSKRARARRCAWLNCWTRPRSARSRLVTEKSPELPEAQRREIARVVGIGAVKYADLLPNRQSDYVFSWDKMLALNGNTAPYLQYAYARIRSIFRKGRRGRLWHPCRQRLRPTLRLAAPRLKLAAPEELALARQLLNFGLVLEAVADDYRPNLLCNYLYELAGHFTAFLRELSCAQGRPRTARQPPGPVRLDGPGLAPGPGCAGDRDAGADVSCAPHRLGESAAETPSPSSAASA